MKKKTKTLIDRELFVKSGRKGGLANSENKGHDFFQTIGKKGALKRWSDKKVSDKAALKSEGGLEKPGIV